VAIGVDSKGQPLFSAAASFAVAEQPASRMRFVLIDNHVYSSKMSLQGIFFVSDAVGNARTAPTAMKLIVQANDQLAGLASSEYAASCTTAYLPSLSLSQCKVTLALPQEWFRGNAARASTVVVLAGFARDPDMAMERFAATIHPRGTPPAGQDNVIAIVPDKTVLADETVMVEVYAAFARPINGFTMLFDVGAALTIVDFVVDLRTWAGDKGISRGRNGSLAYSSRTVTDADDVVHLFDAQIRLSNAALSKYPTAMRIDIGISFLTDIDGNTVFPAGAQDYAGSRAVVSDRAGVHKDSIGHLYGSENLIVAGGVHAALSSAQIFNTAILTGIPIEVAVQSVAVTLSAALTTTVFPTRCTSSVPSLVQLSSNCR